MISITAELKETLATLVRYVPQLFLGVRPGGGDLQRSAVGVGRKDFEIYRSITSFDRLGHQHANRVRFFAGGAPANPDPQHAVAVLDQVRQNIGLERRIGRRIAKKFRHSDE